MFIIVVWSFSREGLLFCINADPDLMSVEKNSSIINCCGDMAALPIVYLVEENPERSV